MSAGARRRVRLRRHGPGRHARRGRDLELHRHPHCHPGELDAGADIVNIVTVTATAPRGDTDDATVDVVQSQALNIEKDASVPDGTADETSDVITYTLHADQHRQRGDLHRGRGRPVTTGAPVLAGGFIGGDTDQDDELDVGETWHYIGQQDRHPGELDAGTDIVNIVTADGDGATADTDDATVDVVQSKALNIEKTLRCATARRTRPPTSSPTATR